MSDQRTRELQRRAATGGPEDVQRALGAKLLPAPAWLAHQAQMRLAPRYVLEQRLWDLMSDMSEDTWCAGWLDGLESWLPRLIEQAEATGEPQPTGWMPLEPGPETREALAIAGVLGHWVDFDMRPVDRDGRPATTP